MSCLAQLRSCLAEILVLVNEVCAASPSNTIIGFYEARHLVHENASAVMVPTSNTNVLGRLLRRKPTQFPDYLRRPDAEQQ
jgi:hypothetical protein